ncbi:hypothetical protein PVAND_001963 [Polypedilum vanderplanki]|uniref:DDE-1 domain-containing protein n=1 Tax=Polypedilum vanderplanki TaxID=319348 RepID=A0A9J6BQT0_POLVA|nr:hypothetical protein PVAND_001963 [Polypedilum vanderplanki]
MLALSRKHNVSVANVKRWVDQRDKLSEQQSSNKPKSIANRKRVDGGGQKESFPELEEKLYAWIKDCNNSVSRRQTSSRILPTNARGKAYDFLNKIKTLIIEKGIEPKNILNFDQTPRFYEQETTSTITTKGSRNVLLKKASANHKKLTVTFLINAAGKLLHTHVLLSKLKKVPSDIKKTNNFSADINVTGMWSKAVLDKYIQDVILKRPETNLLRQPTLLIIDAFSPHVTLAESKRLETYNIYIEIIPPSMTNLLQPIDVVLNKSFQSYYNNKHNDYIRAAINDEKFKTKAGNLKTPSHTQAVEWIKSWANDVSKEMIEKAFLVCGIGSFENNWNSLHGPLKNLLTCENQDTWVEENQNIFLNEKQILIDEDAYFYPIQDTTSPSTSFYKCLHKKKNSQVDFDTWIELYVIKVENELTQNGILH